MTIMNITLPSGAQVGDLSNEDTYPPNKATKIS
jgi:hypothetical protein